jgi:hypothetical protein
MSLKRNLVIGALALTSLGGCSEPRYLEGKVVKESGSAVSLIRSEGALFGNDSVKFGNLNYILTVDTNKGRYIIDVLQDGKSLAALEEAIEVGDTVKFPLDKINSLGSVAINSDNNFGEDRIGSVFSKYISVVKKK